MGCQYHAPTENGADTFTVAMPRLTFGRGCLDEVGARVATRLLKRIALFTDPLLADGPLVARARASLEAAGIDVAVFCDCLLYTSPSPRDLSTSRMPSSA